MNTHGVLQVQTDTVLLRDVCCCCAGDGGLLQSFLQGAHFNCSAKALQLLFIPKGGPQELHTGTGVAENIVAPSRFAANCCELRQAFHNLAELV